MAPSRPVQGFGRVLAGRPVANDPLVVCQGALVLLVPIVQFPDQQRRLWSLRLIGIRRDQFLKMRPRRGLFALGLEAVPQIEQSCGPHRTARSLFQSSAEGHRRGLVVALSQGHAAQLKVEFGRQFRSRLQRERLFQHSLSCGQTVLSRQGLAQQEPRWQTIGAIPVHQQGAELELWPCPAFP